MAEATTTINVTPKQLGKHLRVQLGDDQYIDRKAVAEEIAFSRRLCAKHNWPLIDVTRRSIEETAAVIMALLVGRRRSPVQGPSSNPSSHSC